MDNRYLIIGRSSCPFCVMAQDFLSAKQIKFQFLDYCDKPSILEDYKSFHKQKTVPIILSNDLKTGLVRKIGGYTDLLDHFKCQNKK